MSDSSRLIVAVLLVVVAVVAVRWPTDPTPERDSAAVDAAYLEIFSGPDGVNVAAAREASVLFQSFADFVRWDGTKTAPKFQTVAQVDDFGATFRDFFLGGQRLTGSAPKLGPKVAAELEPLLGKDHDAAFDRVRFVAALERIARGCKSVVQGE